MGVSFILRSIFILLVLFTNAFALEIIVIMRHGEKPPGGLGQLTCR